MRCLACVLLISFSLTACTEPGSRWTGTVEDSAGVTLVRNPATGIWGPGEEWTVAEDLRIGAAEGEPAYEFAVVLRGGVAVDSQGRIFVLDSQAQEIRLFSPQGEYVRTLASRGGGPGELASARDILMGPGDTLFVPDWRNQRMSRFAPDGSFAGSSEFLPRKEGLSRAFRTNRSGLIAEQVDPRTYGRAEAERGDTQDVVVRWSSGRSRSDTLARIPSSRTYFWEGGWTHSVLYAPDPCWDLTDDGGLLFGMSDEYRFSFTSPDGELTRIVTRAYEPQPVLDRDKERALAHMEKRWRTMDAGPQIPRLLSQTHFSDFFPAFRALYAGPEGTTWVQGVTHPSEMEEDEALWWSSPSDWGTRGWDVFDSEGRYLGVVTMPPRFTPSVFRGDRIYGVALDTLGVSYVVRLRVAGMDAGS